MLQQGMPKPGWMDTPDSPGSDLKFKVSQFIQHCLTIFVRHLCTTHRICRVVRDIAGTDASPSTRWDWLDSTFAWSERVLATFGYILLDLEEECLMDTKIAKLHFQHYFPMILRQTLFSLPERKRGHQTHLRSTSSCSSSLSSSTSSLSSSLSSSASLSKHLQPQSHFQQDNFHHHHYHQYQHHHHYHHHHHHHQD